MKAEKLKKHLDLIAIKVDQADMAILKELITDFAEKEAIEFLRWDDKISGIVRHDVDYENKYKEYAK